MKSIKLLVMEHENIIRACDTVHKMNLRAFKTGEISIEDYQSFLDFGANYADKHHHQKEEKVLFKHMLENLGEVASTLIKNGMLVEHDLGRYHARCLKKALTSYGENYSDEAKLAIIYNSEAYTELLRRHIDKENAACYTFAERALSSDIKEIVEKETFEIEAEASENDIQSKYLNILATLEAKY